MPVFRMKKEPFNWIKTGTKTVELRKGKAKKGDNATFLSGKSQVARGKILKKQEGKLSELLNSATYNNIVPTAKNLSEATEYLKRIYSSLEGTFTAYEIEITDQKTLTSLSSAHQLK